MDRLAISSVKVMSESQLLGREEVESFIERLRWDTDDMPCSFFTSQLHYQMAKTSLLVIDWWLIRNFSESNIKKENDETDQEMMAVCQREFDTYGKFIDTFEQSNLVTKNSIDYFTYLIRTKQNNYLIHDSVDIGSCFNIISKLIALARNLCEIDLNNSFLLQVHISILAEIGDKTSLFKIAHRLIGMCYFHGETLYTVCIY